MDFPGFNVLRVSPGPWFVVFNPGGLTVGDALAVAADPRLLIAGALPASGTLIDVSMIQLQVLPGPPPSCQIVLPGSVWTFASPGYPPICWRRSTSSCKKRKPSKAAR